MEKGKKREIKTAEIKTKNTWLKGKTVVITGASGGIGFSITKILLEEYGAKVIGICRIEKKMLAALESVRVNKENFSYRLFDVRDDKKWEEFGAEIAASDSGADVLINNAGFMLPFEKFEKITAKERDEIIDTDFRANLVSTATLLPILKKSSVPCIVNIASSSSMCAVVGESMYTAVKFAMKGFTDALRVEYKGKISVVGIYPGFVKTDIMQRQKTDVSGNKLISSFMASVEKTGKKCVKAIVKRKKTVPLGIDGKFMCFFGRLFPNFTASVIAGVLKSSKQELFSDVFDYKS